MREDIGKIHNVEYNSIMSLMKLIGDRLPHLMIDYGFSKKCGIDIIPAYPRDLTALRMPSIIVRKVNSDDRKVSLNGFIGQYYDESENSLTDIKAIRHDMCYQFDILASSNTQVMAIHSMILEGILDNILLCEKGWIAFYDFITDQNNPEDVGTLCMIGAPRAISLSSWRISVQEPSINEYAAIIRQDLALIQTVVPKQEYVDLSLWIKQHINVKIKEE